MVPCRVRLVRSSPNFNFGEVTGFCFGKRGEMSGKLHDLIHRLARSRLVLPGLRRKVGRNGKELEDSALLAEFVGSLRRQFSFTGVRAQSRLLLDRLDVLAGAGVGEDARRNGAAAAVERGARNEREAQALAIRESREIVRRGRFMER